MNLARPAAFPGLALAALGAAAVLPVPRQEPAMRMVSRAPGLRLRAPDLSAPVSERLPDPSRPADPVKVAVLARINEDRERHGVPPVEWDEAASRASDVFCTRQVEERSRGHYLMDGIPPYGRLSFAGVFGSSSENAASWITTGPRFTETTVALALEAEEKMMEERPPGDGHRRTILDPQATHVGVGYAIHRGRFQMSEEFLTRRLESVTLAAPERPRASVVISGKPVAGHRLHFVTIAREPVPRPLTREEATARTTYSYPGPFLAYVPEGQRAVRIVGVETEDRLRILPGSQFSFSFTPDRPGLYTFSFYVAARGEHPFPGGTATVWVQ